MRKTVLKILTFCAILTSFFGLFFLSVPIFVKAEPDMSAVADFSVMSIAGAEQMGFEIENLATDSYGHKTYGAVPGAVWGATVSGGNATVLYELNAGDGYLIKNGQLSFDVGVGHAGGIYWYNQTGTLGANFKVYISTNNVNWTEIFDLDETTQKIRTNEHASRANGRYSNADTPISLNDYFAQSRKCYIKFEILHFTLSEAIAAQPAASGWATMGGIPLDRIGLCLYKISISAEKEEGEDANVVQIKNDFTKSGTVSSFQGVIDHKGLVRDNNGNAVYPLVPAAAWGATVNTRTGEIIYKISAEQGYIFSSTTLNLTFACFAPKEEFKGGNADLIVQVSRDYVVWDKIYSSYETRGVSTTTAWLSDTLSLNDYGSGMGVLYIKIILQCPEVNNVGLNKVPVLLKEVILSATQEEIVDGSSNTLVFGNEYGTEISANYEAITESSGLYDGTADFGLLPTVSGGEDVTTGNGYFVYRLTAPENKMYQNVRLTLAYKLLSGANVRIQYALDDLSYSGFFDASEHLGRIAYKNNLNHGDVVYQMLDINLYSIVRNKRDIYLKIFIDHPVGTYSLQDLKAEFFSINVQSTYADYIAISNITYYLNGGNYVDGDGNPTEYTATTPEIVLQNPVKKYFDFKGWYDNAGFSGNAITSIDTSVAKDWQLYAKFEQGVSVIHITVVGKGVLKDGEDTVITGDSVQVSSGENYTIKLEPANGWLIYSLKISDVEVLLKNNAYVFTNIDGEFDAQATFVEKQTIAGDFSVDYQNCQKYHNDWKTGLYDFDNLYITDDSFHALGNDNGIGYIVYKFVPAEDVLTFESASLVTVAKLNDYVGMQTNERVNYYISYDDENYELIYESPLNRLATNVVSTTQNLSEYVYDRNEFYLKVIIGSNSANWTLLYSLDIEFTYRTVELTVDYGDYTDVLYTQYKNKPLDTSLIVPKDGYELISQTVYSDPTRSLEFDLNEPITEDTKIYVSAMRVQEPNTIVYVLNGGENSAQNVDEYSTEQLTVLYPATREGYLFGGWYFDANCTLRVVEITAGRYGSITLYAKWIEDVLPEVPVKWEITYVLNGGENSAANFTVYQTGTGVELQAAARIGYIFGGWYSDAELKNKIERIDESSVGHITLYAKWTIKDQPEQETSKISSGTIAVVLSGIAVGGTIIAISLVILLKKRRIK